MKAKFSKQQWMVLIGACLFQCALIGVLVNSTGVLLAQIRTEFGFALTRVSAFNTVKSVVCALGGVALTSLFFKSKKWVFMLCNILLTILSYCLLVFDAENQFIWYTAAVLNGFNACTVTVMVPYILNQWFPENAGTVTGFSVAFSGIGGIVFNPITAELIGCFGWRWTILILSTVTIILGVTAILLLFHNAAQGSRTEAKQTDAAEFSETVTNELPLKRIILCALALGAGCFVMQFSQYITIFAQSIGYTLQVGAALTSLVMIGNVGGKLLFGLICDKIGTYKAMVFAMAAVATASLLYAVFNRFLPVLYIASILYGMVYSLVMISPSRCCIQTYGAEGVKKYMGIHTSVNGIIQTVSSMSVGILYDATGGFEAELIIGLVFLGIFSIAALLLCKMGKRSASISSVA